MLKQVGLIRKAVRDKSPLVQAITNYVTINDCANMLLCFGASPAMVEAKEEAAEFAGLASSLYINLGTLTKEQEEAALLAVEEASRLRKPIVLDPVACGAVSRKKATIDRLLERGKFSMIKGNVGEIKSLAGFAGKVRGVDSVDDGEGAMEACQGLAKELGTVVIATGPRDIVTDGERVCYIDNGTKMFTLVSGAGCMAGALCAATAAVWEDRFEAGVAAITAMGVAGEIAANSLNKVLPGSFRVKLLDAIYGLTEEDLLEGGRIHFLG